MQRKFLIIILIIFILSALVFCSLRWLGCKNSDTGSKLAGIEKSKLIDAWLIASSGNVGRITEKEITITKDKEILNFIIPDGVRVFSFDKLATDIDSLGENKQQEEISLGDLQIGDYVSIFSEINSEGNPKALNITVFK